MIWPSSSWRNSERAPCSTPGAPAHRRTVPARLEAETACLIPTSPRGGVDEAREGAHRVRPAAHAGDHEVGVVATENGAALLTGFVADDPLELAHHPRVRVRTHHRADAVVRRLDGRHPVAQRFVDRVLERGAPTGDGDDVGTEQLHAEHVERLAFDVDRAHEHQAVEPEQRGRGGGRPPCWPAPVSAITRCLPIRRVSSAWPSTLLILCEPVWVRSSRFSSTRTPRRSDSR